MDNIFKRLLRYFIVIIIIINLLFYYNLYNKKKTCFLGKNKCLNLHL